MQHGHGGVDARHRLRLPRVEPRSLAQPAADGLRLLAQVDDLRTLHPRPTETSPARPTVPSQVKLAKCEADGVFSAANEGPFAGKAANHIPTIHCDGTAVTIKVPGSEDEVSRAPAPDETAGSSGPRAATRSIDDRAGRRDRARRRARSMIERADPSREGRRRRAWRARPAPRNGGGTRSRNRRSTTTRGEPGADRGHGDGGALPLRRYVYAKREGAVIFYKEIKAGEVRGPRPPTRARRRRRARARRRRRSRSRRARATTSPPLPRSPRPASGPRRRRSSHEKTRVARAASRPGRRGLAARGPSRPPH